MSFFPKKQIQNIAVFNPSEKLPKGTIAKSVPMAMLKEFQRKIKGYEIKPFNGGAKFRNGDILLAKITPCLENGKTAFVDILDEDEVAFGSTEFIVLRANENTNPEFLYYFSTSPDFRKRAIECMEGTSGRQRVNENTLKTLELPIPDLPTQQAIASVLSALDQKIAINNQINAQLEQMAKTLYDYWFVQFDFPDENGKPYQSNGGEMVYNDTLKRNIPKGWEFGKLKDVLDNYSNSIKSDNLNKQSFYTPIDCLPIRKMSFWQTQPIDNAKTSLITYETNDILIGAMRVYFHRVCIAPFSGVTRSTTMVLRPKIKTNLPYLYQLCNEDKTIEYASSVSVGTQQPYVNWENGLAEFNIILPNLFLIQEYSKKVECLIKQIILNEKQNQQLTQLRDFLLPMLMNGQVMVQDV